MTTERGGGPVLEAMTPLGFRVRVSQERWALITTAKYPIMSGREDAVKTVLEVPDEVRESRADRQVLLFYKSQAAKRRTCAVKRVGNEGFLITTYPTDAIKEGVRVWPN